MNGSSHFIFKGLTVINTNGRGFWLQNGADSNTIEDCRIYLNEAATTAASGGIVSSASATALTAGADVDGMIVRNNLISGGYHGIASYGNTATSKVKGWVIEGNTLSNQYYYGVYSNYNDGVVIRKNSIKGLRNTTSHGIYLLNTDNFDIEANTIHDAKTYGVYVSTANGGLTTPPAVRSRFVNNMVAVPASGAYFTSVNHVDVFHNSIEGTYGFRLFTPTFMSIRNNIFVGISNYAFESGTALVTPNQVNYNLYHKRGGTNLIKDGTPTYANLALWQTAVAAQNTNSIEGDPLFRSTTDLHATGTIANDVGDNTVGVNVDIDNDVRPASGSTVVDMGADEYTPLSIDIAVISLNTTPLDGTCGDSLTQIEVTVVNRGISSITSIPVNVTVNGAISTTFSSTIAGPLAPLASTVINVGPLNTAGGGSFLIMAYSSLTTDQDNSNDTISGAFAYKSVQAPQITAFLDSFCTGSFDTLYAPKGSGDKFEWRDINGGFISNGEKLTVGPLGTTDTTFLLATTSQQYSVGPLNNSIGTAGNFTDPSVQQIHFTALQSFTLDSVTVYPNGNGNVNINLLDFTSNTVLQTITVPVTGVVAPGTAIRIAVGMVIPPGTYKMHGGGSTTGGLWRNSTGAVHPYTLPGVVSITGNSFGAAYFYYFYNWKVSALSCIRPEGRITLYAGAAGIVPSFTSMQQSPTTTSMQIDFNAIASVGGTSYSWDFGDGNVGSGIATSHVYSANGTYQVVLTVTSSCGSKTITKTIVVAGIGMDENPLNNSLVLYPNPTSSQLTVSFTRAANSTVRIRMIDMAGKEVLKLNVDGSANQLFEEKLNINELNDGIYLLEITDGSFSVKRRVVKN
jgi:PKD repeat protein